MTITLTLAALAVEYWKILRSLEKVADTVSMEAKQRLVAQLRYAAGRLDTLLNEAKLKIVTFDGEPFEVNLPAVAINGEDVAHVEGPIVERTIEPAVISDVTVLLMGKVFLVPSSHMGAQ